MKKQPVKKATKRKTTTKRPAKAPRTHRGGKIMPPVAAPDHVVEPPEPSFEDIAHELDEADHTDPSDGDGGDDEHEGEL